MRILHINKFFDLHGGAEVYMHRLMARQAAAGHGVHAFSTRAPGNVASADAARFVPRNDLASREGAASDASKAAAFVWNGEAKAAMERTLDEVRPDLVHVHNIYHHLSTSVLAPVRARRIPCVQTLHDYKLACPNYKMFTEGTTCERCKGGKYYEAVRHKCLTASFAGNALAAFEMGLAKAAQSYERTVRAFICPSRFMAQKMVAWGEPASKMHVVPNPSEDPVLDARGDGAYVLAVGRLSPEKGFSAAVRAAAALPGVELRLAGTGAEEPVLRKLAERSRLGNVRFLGYADKRRLEEERRHARALVVPSVWYENAPLVVLEAMAQGLPIVASRIGGLPELVEDGVNGYLVAPGDAGELAAAIARIVALPRADWERMSKAAIAAVRDRHGWAGHLEELERIYHAVT